MEQKSEKGVFYITREAYEWFKKEYARVYSHFVYVHTSPEGKKYVGHGKGKPNNRWDSGYGYKNMPELMEDIKKYGWENVIKIRCMENILEESAIRLEQFLIRINRTTDPERGYNKSVGGETEGGWHSSEESKTKAAEKLKGRKNKPEQIQHMKDAAAPRYKPVLNETTGEMYPSQAAAAEALGVDKTTISAALRGKLKTVKGCVLKRIEHEKQARMNLVLKRKIP